MLLYEKKSTEAGGVIVPGGVKKVIQAEEDHYAMMTKLYEIHQTVVEVVVVDSFGEEQTITYARETDYYDELLRKIVDTRDNLKNVRISRYSVVTKKVIGERAKQ